MLPIFRRPLYPGIQKLPCSAVGNSFRAFTDNSRTNCDKSSFIFVPGVLPFGYFVGLVFPFQLLSSSSTVPVSGASNGSHLFSEEGFLIDWSSVWNASMPLECLWIM